MTVERRRTSRWRRLGVKLILPALAAPVLAVAAADLWLCSPWGRGWLGGKISHRAGLTVKIGPSLWTPWSGVVVHGIEIEPPDSVRDSFEGPVLKTGDIEVDPNWLETLRRRKPFIERICVNDPDVTLTPGVLLAISAARKAMEPAEEGPAEAPAQTAEEAHSIAAAKTADVALPGPAPAAAPPLVAQTPAAPSLIPVGPALIPASPQILPPKIPASPAVLARADPGGKSSPQGSPAAASPAEVAPPAVEARPPGAGSQAPPSVEALPPGASPQAPPPVDSRPPMVIEIRRAHLRVLRIAGEEPLAEVSDASLRLPLQGADADGSISLAALKLAGRPLLESVSIPVKWRSPEVQIEQQHVSLAGSDLEISLRLARLSGLPFLTEIRSPLQALPLWDAPLNRKISARRMEGLMRFGGSLPAPFSWKGGAEAGFENLRIEGEERTVVFDRGDGAVFFGDGVVRCPEARLIGEDFSLLGNGVFSRESKSNAAVFRWVAHPEVLKIWSQKVQSIDPGLKVQITPLETPERALIDFSWVASGEEPGIELGAGGSVVRLAVFASFIGH